MNFNDSFSNKDILIPQLQRDYVQGADKSVIEPFLDSLLSKNCDLNYIYGYTETVRKDEKFVPIDGQQRLITLWLLHLYLHSRLDIEYSVKLSFLAREFASEFCKRLAEHMPAIMNSTETDDLKDAIIDQSWFITAWLKNATVRNMLSTLALIHCRLAKHDRKSIQYLRELVEKNITFDFLDMDKSNKLDDDIYVKMNGRGRALSQFENLKSWMDKKVRSLPIAESWRRKIDNRWTDMFWKHGNSAQGHPEDIDDEQLHCFANLLALFHKKNPGFLLKSIQGYQERLCEYLGLAESITIEGNERKIANTLVDNLINGIMPPLVWFDRVDLMPEEFFEFAHNGLNRLCELAEEFGRAKIHCLPDNKTYHTIYDLAMGKASYASTLPMMYALMKAPKACTDLKDWMRIVRNLILNSEKIDANTIKDVLDSIEAFSKSCEKKNIFGLIQTDECKKILRSFDKTQVEEEIHKAENGLSGLRDAFAELENTRFFEGRIRCMFDFLPSDSALHRKFRNYSQALMTLFNHSDGLNPEFDDKNHFFRRALMTYPPYDYGYWIKEGWWSFCHDFSGWREYVRNQEYKSGAISSLLEEFCSEDFDSNTFKAKLEERVERISRLPKEQVGSEKTHPYSYYLLHHAGVWNKLNYYKFVRWGGEYDVVMCTSNLGNYSRMELRTFCLYLDYANDPELVKSREGWTVNIWPHQASCLFFEKKISLNGSERTIAIDVYFKNSETGCRDCENCYGFDLFVRTQGLEMTQQQVTQEVITSGYSELIKSLGLKYDNEDGRVRSTHHYSREGIIDGLAMVFDYINKRS